VTCSQDASGYVGAEVKAEVKAAVKELRYTEWL
jgi:hypothetical protein